MGFEAVEVQRHLGDNLHLKNAVAVFDVLFSLLSWGVALPLLVWLWGLGDQDSQQGELHTLCTRSHQISPSDVRLHFADLFSYA